MSKSPAFQFYVRDWLCSRKVFSMSGDAVKAYVYLLCEAWLQEPRATLPVDEKELASMARIDVQKWRTISTELMQCFAEKKVGDFSRFVNERLSDVSLQYFKNQRPNNKNARRTRIRREKTPNRGSSTASSSSSSTASSSAIAIPENIRAVWPAFVEMRKAKKKPMTDHIAGLIFAELKKFTTNPAAQVRIIERSIMNGWAGVFQLPDEEKKTYDPSIAKADPRPSKPPEPSEPPPTPEQVAESRALIRGTIDMLKNKITMPGVTA